MWSSFRIAAQFCSCWVYWLNWLWSDTCGSVDCISSAHTDVFPMCASEYEHPMHKSKQKTQHRIRMQMSLENYKIQNDIVSIVYVATPSSSCFVVTLTCSVPWDALVSVNPTILWVSSTCSCHHAKTQQEFQFHRSWSDLDMRTWDSGDINNHEYDTLWTFHVSGVCKQCTTSHHQAVEVNAKQKPIEVSNNFIADWSASIFTLLLVEFCSITFCNQLIHSWSH